MKKTHATAIGGILIALASPFLKEHVSDFEGTESVPYVDPVGITTVCMGYTGVDIVPGKRYSKSECDLLLVQELSEHGQAVLQLVSVPLNQKLYDSLTSFTYNVGVANLAKSTLLRKLNSGDYLGACNEMMRWVYAGGQRLKGLVRRREAEKQMCIDGVAQGMLS